MDGKYTRKDVVTGFSWIQRAADAGDSAAEVAVAAFHIEGTGTTKDREAARSLLEAVYRKKDAQAPTAAYLLGLIYMDDTGVRANTVQAFYWMSIAANENVPGAEERTKTLIGLLPKQKLATECGVFMDAKLATKEYAHAEAGETIATLTSGVDVVEVFFPDRRLSAFISTQCLRPSKK